MPSGDLQCSPRTLWKVWGKCSSPALLQEIRALGLNQLGGSTSEESALYKQTYKKLSVTLPQRSIQIWNRFQNLNDQSQGSLKKSVCLDCSGGWWGVCKFCVKCYMMFACENLSMGTETGQAKRQCQWRGYQNMKKREGAYCIQLIRQWPYSSPI